MLLSTNLFAHILSRPGAAAFTGAPGEVIARFRDDVNEVSTYVSIIRLLSGVGELLTTTVILALMLRINAFVTVAAALLSRWCCWPGAPGSASTGTGSSRAATGRVTGALGEAFAMVQAIKLAGAEERVTDHLSRLGDRRRSETVKDTLFSELLRSIFFNTANLEPAWYCFWLPVQCGPDTSLWATSLSLPPIWAGSPCSRAWWATCWPVTSRRASRLGACRP